MPLYRQWQEPGLRQIAVWKITEPEAFFTAATGMQSNRKQEHRRLEHLAGRFLLQLLQPDISVKDILVNPLGKPFHPHHSVRFSISHSYPYVAVAIHPSEEVGLDLQVITSKIERLQHKFLSAEEQYFTEGNPARITLAWTAKEAAFKWFGEGQIDFIRHMPITHMEVQGTQARMEMEFKRCQPSIPLFLPGGIEPDFTWAIAIPQ